MDFQEIKEIQCQGTYVYLWLIHVDVWQKPTQFCKAFIFPLKNKQTKKKVSFFFQLGRIDILFFPVFLIHLTVLFLSMLQYYKAILHLSLF